MKNLTTKRGLRCAIYTRVSTDQGGCDDGSEMIHPPPDGL